MAVTPSAIRYDLDRDVRAGKEERQSRGRRGVADLDLVGVLPLRHNGRTNTNGRTDGPNIHSLTEIPLPHAKCDAARQFWHPQAAASRRAVGRSGVCAR